MRQWIRHLAVIVVILAFARDSARAQSPATAPATKIRDVVVVFKTHFDIGYTDLSRNVCDMYATTMIDKALDVCDKNRHLPQDQQFVWTLPGWPLDYILNNPKQTPERRERVLAGLRDGHFVFHALPFTTHTESMELEDYVRGMRFSSDLAKSLGQPLPRDAKMTDVPSHVWSLPTILAHAGVQFLHLGVNRGSTTPDVPPLFWWEGPDGSRVLTMVVLGYGTGLTPPPDWPYPTWLALMHTKDNVGPPEPQIVQQLLDQAKTQLPNAKVRMGRLSDFADAILKDHPDLPVVRSDMPDTWIHGLASMPVETALSREVRPMIAELDTLNTLLRVWGTDVAGTKDVVAAAYEQSLMYGEHTWGMDVKKFGPRLYGDDWKQEQAKGAYAKLEDSWNEHGERARKADALIRPALAEQMKTLVAAVAADGLRVVVFNPLPWERDDVVTITMPDMKPSALKDLADGATIPVEAEGSAIRFVARRVPPLGYRTYVPADGAGNPPPLLIADDKAGVLENNALRVHLDAANGAIASLYDKVARREWAGRADDIRFGQYLHQRFDADDVQRFLEQYADCSLAWVYGDFGKKDMPPATKVRRSMESPKGFSVKMRSGPLSATATMSAPPTEAVPHDVSLSVTLYRDLPYVDLEWSIRNKPGTPWPEAGWLVLPVAVEQPKFLLGRMGAFVDPATQVQRATNRDVYCLNTGLTVAGSDDAGLGICPVDAPLVSLDRPGLWQFSKDFVPQRPRVYVNLYNNEWSTNFPQWVAGSWSSRVRVWPVAGGDATSRLLRPAWEARSRCAVVAYSGPAGARPVAAEGIRLSRDGVLITAFGPNPDGDGVLLRLWEQGGRDGLCRVTLPSSSSWKLAQPCDLRGRPAGKSLSIRDGAFVTPLTQYAPASFLLLAH